MSILFTNCSKEVVKLNPIQQTILESSVYSNIPQLQSEKESMVLKENLVKSMSFIKEYVDSNRIDSLTYLRFNKDGKLIQRTTENPTTAGCLPYTLVQIFRYENGKIKRVENYIFKYKVNNIFEKWMETDTSRLKMFDWEDYTYIGDTIIIESGVSKCSYVNDEKGNLISSTNYIKSTKHISNVRYLSTPFGVKSQLVKGKEESSVSDYLDYEVERNKVGIKTSLLDNAIKSEKIFNEKGLLIEILSYKNDKVVVRTKVSYIYYQ